VWPTVLARLRKSNIRNYSIFLREPENLLFSYFEYHGNDFDADMKVIESDPDTQRWWQLTEPCQRALDLPGGKPQWLALEQVFLMD
jgi:L-rhamnose mutarotase